MLFAVFVYARIVCFYILLRYSPMVSNLVGRLGWNPFEMGVCALTCIYRIRIEGRAREREKGERAINASLDFGWGPSFPIGCLRSRAYLWRNDERAGEREKDAVRA